ncbi:MAG: Mrp/NBP35 family ATP-binding protein [Candidatus Thermoplasmatota archaeon]|nr:Mrp/NBP35 family ATP-binding protein [Candidatus Thermoplasmatota archaeon]
MEVRTSVIDKRLDKIKRIISIASGKGGVGKSLVATSFALILSKKGYKVGLLDLDICGPSSHIILGINDFSFPKEEKGIIPHKFSGIKFMSIVYFSQDKPAPLRGTDITNVILELLAITLWGELDYLIIDMPPGIGDETLDVIHLIKKSEFVVVSTPSKVALGAVDKLLNILKELKLPVLGIVENMKINDITLIQDYAKGKDFNYLGSISYDLDLECSIGFPDKLMNSCFMNDFEKVVKKII